MNKKAEGILSIVAALLLIFTSMLNPLVTIILAVVIMVVFGVYSIFSTK